MKLACTYLAFLSLMSSSMAIAGSEAGNGGDSLVFEFLNIAALNYTVLKKGLTPQVDPNAYRSVTESTNVESTFETLYDKDGMERDALNFPEQRKIRINRVRWNAMTQAKKEILVLHEYLGILGISDPGYDVSSRALGLQDCESGVMNTDPYATVSGYQYFGGQKFTRGRLFCEEYSPGERSRVHRKLVIDLTGKKITADVSNGGIEKYFITTFDENDGFKTKIALNIVATIDLRNSTPDRADNPYVNGKIQIISTEAMSPEWKNPKKWPAVLNKLINQRSVGGGGVNLLECQSSL
ncbi:MAG TPA: hypothetical protein VJB59_15710 [Bdellovibrionota bacterium]|nr:hypothetical protein [Bdellovibrionota bacterium]